MIQRQAVASAELAGLAERRDMARLCGIECGLRENVACCGRARNRCGIYIVEVYSQSHA